MYINQNLLKNYPRYMHIRIFAETPDLCNKYYEAIYNHNSKINNNPIHIDAGFDLFAPNAFNMTNQNVVKIDYQIKCSAQIVELDTNGSVRTYNTGYYMHPRSSISKTPLRLANSTGIVDSGYRGNLIGMFDCLRPQYTVDLYDRLIQICAPGLIPIYAELVNNIDDLGAETIRGTNGIGSSGR